VSGLESSMRDTLGYPYKSQHFPQGEQDLNFFTLLVIAAYVIQSYYPAANLYYFFLTSVVGYFLNRDAVSKDADTLNYSIEIKTEFSDKLCKILSPYEVHTDYKRSKRETRTPTVKATVKFLLNPISILLFLVSLPQLAIDTFFDRGKKFDDDGYPEYTLGWRYGVKYLVALPTFLVRLALQVLRPYFELTFKLLEAVLVDFPVIGLRYWAMPKNYGYEYLFDTEETDPLENIDRPVEIMLVAFEEKQKESVGLDPELSAIPLQGSSGI